MGVFKTRNNDLYVTFLVLSLVILISACAQINPSEKLACEKSGGEYLQGASEAGSINYCKCPITKYETYQKTCTDITQNEIAKCAQLTNKFFTCKNSKTYNDYYGEGICECVSKQNVKSYFTYKELLKCTCNCIEDGCTCVCPIK